MIDIATCSMSASIKVFHNTECTVHLMLLPFPQATANDKVGPCGPGVGNRSTCFVSMAEYPAVKQKKYHSREGGGVGEAGHL